MKFKAVLQINSGVAIIAETVWTWGVDQYGTFVVQCQREMAQPWGSDGGFKCIVMQEWALFDLKIHEEPSDVEVLSFLSITNQ